MTITPINLRSNERIRSAYAVMSCMDTLVYFNKDAINKLGCPSRVSFDDFGTTEWFIKKDEDGFRLRRKNEYGGMITQNSRVLISKLESIFGKKKPKFILMPTGNLDTYQLKLIE